MTSVEELANKQAGGSLTNEEWNTAIKALQECQNPVKKIIYNTREFSPNSEGTVEITVLEAGIDVNLSTFSNKTHLITTDNTVKLKIRFTSTTTTTAGITQNTGEMGVLTIKTRQSEDDAWVTAGQKSVASVDYEDEEAYAIVDVTELFTYTQGQIQITAAGENTGTLAGQTLVFADVVKTSLSLTFVNNWQNPITESQMDLNFLFTGAVDKNLIVKVDNKRTLTVNLGTAVRTETAYTVTFKDATAEVNPVMTQGIHTIEAYLYAVNDTTVVSNTVKAQVLVFTDTTDTTTYLIVNEYTQKIANWEQTTFFKYAVYKYGSEGTEVSFKIANYGGDVNYLTYIQGAAQNNVQYTFNNTFEIESTDDSIDAYLKVYDVDENQIYTNTFLIDNSNNFNPTSGAVFILNPKLRSNDETSPNTIVNTATGNTVTATFNNFGFVSDGWVEENSIKRLRVPAGSNLTIDYETFDGFDTTASRTASLTIELDVATNNIYDEDTPVLKMCSYYDSGMPLGFELKPLEACFMTRDKEVRRDQDIMFTEGVRTHIAVNIVYNLSQSGLNYVRIFVNGKINREFNWLSSDIFIRNNTSGGIQIGSTGADIDIYGLRIYKKGLSSSDIQQDYVASLPTTAEKLAFRTANDILNDNGLIGYEESYSKYNTLLYKGIVPNYTNQGNGVGTGDLIINIIGDEEHSGTINDVSIKGQGTSSKTYWKWNHQYGFTADTTDESGNITKVGSRWTDKSGTVKGAYYCLTSDSPKATKLVAKLNWASSMQSHKIGATALFNDLKKVCVGLNGMQKSDSKYRVAVLEKPFLYFVQGPNDDKPVFYGFMTFGAGKGDKKTFGYDGDFKSGYLMLEGSANYMALTERRIPWTDEEVTYNAKEEYFEYNGYGQLDFDLGSVDEFSITVPYFKNAFNFTYSHSLSIKPYIGTYEDLVSATNAEILAGTDSLNRDYVQYWVTKTSDTHNKFELFRYDKLSNSWVNAGITRTALGEWNVVDINEQCGSKYTADDNDYDAMNTYFKSWRTSDFKSGIGDYYDTQDALFNMTFCKLFGASDNRCKNTYEYLDPTDHLIKFAGDDLDTILQTDNVGRKNKPYYVEEHDFDSSGGNYWNSENNVFYDLMEAAFEAEQRSMMKSIFTAMATSVSSPFVNQDGYVSGSVYQCMEDYFFWVQRYFPAVAYNETARLLYEDASIAQNTFDSNGNALYSNNTDPITQSLGDQLQSEIQWWKRREIYMSSYASYGVFAYPFNGSISFRSILTKASGTPTYNFDLIPYMWLYPVGGVDNTTMAYGKNYTVSQRVNPSGKYVRIVDGKATATDDQFCMDGVTGGSNCNIFIAGANYYKTLGEMGDKAIGETLVLNGTRLEEFSAKSEDPEFRITGITVNATALKKLDLYGISTLVGGLNLESCPKMEILDLRKTGVNNISFENLSNLKELHFPASITDIVLNNKTHIETIDIEGTSQLSTITVSNCAAVVTDFILDTLYTTLVQ